VYSDLSASCILPTNITANVANPIPSMTEGSTNYYSVFIDVNVGSMTTFEIDASASLNFISRYYGSPSLAIGHKDGTSGTSSYVEFPRSGLYYIAVQATSSFNSTNVSFIVRTLPCTQFLNLSGPYCSYYYNTSNPNIYALTIGSQNYSYWQLVIPALSYSSVSIAPDLGDLWDYQLFASYGQLPQSGNADVSNCYQSSCSAALTINVTNKALSPVTWYVSVLSTTVNNTYSIWFNGFCSPVCSQNGVCITTGLLIGECQCLADYSGASCQISSALSAQYIVLIVIACLLFTSSIVGFIAQAYLKRKGYQNI